MIRVSALSEFTSGFQVHIGVYGVVSTTIGHKIPHAEIIVEGIKHTVKTAEDGDYWRLLLPGKYNITYTARGYEPYTTEIVSNTFDIYLDIINTNYCRLYQRLVV